MKCHLKKKKWCSTSCNTLDSSLAGDRCRILSPSALFPVTSLMSESKAKKTINNTHKNNP